jgi:hypothetical protein
MVAPALTRETEREKEKWNPRLELSSLKRSSRPFAARKPPRFSSLH